MRTSVLVILLCILSLQSGFAQILKIDNGVSISSNNAKFDILGESVTNYAGFIGLDYCQHKLFMLSSQIGYLSKGGGDKISIFEEGYTKLKATWGYLHLNTTFRIKTPGEKFYLFVGAGPKLDISLNDKYYKRMEDSYNIKLNRCSFGAKTEAGIIKNFDNFTLGLNFSYLLNVNDIAKAKIAAKEYSYGITNNNFLVTLSLGYILNSR